MAVTSVLAIVLVAIIYGSSHLTSHDSERNTQEATEAQIAELNVNGRGGATFFRIPKVYLSFPPNRAGGEQEEIEILAILPDMKPLAVVRREMEKEGLTRDQLEGRLISNSVHIYLRPGWRYTVKRLRDSSILPPNVKQKFPIENGLQYLGRQSNSSGKQVGRTFIDRPGQEGIRTLGIVQTEYYVPVHQKDDSGLYIDCPFPEKFPRGRCTAHKDVTSRLSAKIMFHSARLAEWQEITRKAANLIDSFVVQ